MTSKETSRNLDDSWTITSVFNNNTDYKFIPVTPPDAEWYGAMIETPDILLPNSTAQNAGEWRAHSGTWTGITAISAYQWVDNSSIMVLLVEMPYSGPHNNTRVQIMPSGTSVNEDLVKSVWNNGRVNATISGKDAKGQQFNLFLNSTIENGDQVTATFTLTPVGDQHAAEHTA